MVSQAEVKVESVTCHHREKVESTPALPGIEIGTCSLCGQTIQYDHNKGMETTVTLTRLGRIDGKIVLPKHGLQLFLGSEDKKELDAVLSAPVSEPALTPSPAPRKHQKRKNRDQYWHKNREAITNDYYIMPLLDFFKKWGLGSHVWQRLKAEWKVEPKGPVNRYTTKATEKTEPRREPKPAPKYLPDLPAFNEEWTPAVKIEWLRTYKELRLARER